MLRARHALMFLLPAILVGYAACGGEDASEETTTDNVGVAEAQVSTAPMILGTFRDEHSPAGIAVLTLKKDMTFHLEEAVECIHAPCVRPEMNGLYKMTSVDGAPVLMLMNKDRLTTETPAPVEYLKYLHKGNVLYVAPVARYSTWQALTLSEQAWCDVSNDCALQDLPGGTCAGQWYCATDVCKYTCGRVTCDMDNTCPAE